MKKLIIILITIITFMSLDPKISFAQVGMMGNYYNNDNSPSPSQTQTEQQYQQNLQNLINGVLSSQKVSSVNQLNCQKVSNDQFEKVGDAWMDVRTGNEVIHQRMDQMLGGEGSQSLINAHIQMGENSLGCPLTGNQTNWMPMMYGFQNNVTGGGGFPMMGWGGYGYNSMMNGNFGWFGAFVFIGWLFVLIDLILAGVWLWQQIRSPRKK